MNWELIKHKFCRLVVTASLLLGGVMVSAAASGTMPLWAALLGLFAAVVMLYAYVDYLKAATFQHGSHQVLADIMQVAFHGSNDHLAYGGRGTPLQ